MKLRMICCWAFSMLGLVAAPLELGESLPEVEGMTDEGKKVKIEPKEGDEWLLVFFYPKAMTGG